MSRLNEVVLLCESRDELIYQYLPPAAVIKRHQPATTVSQLHQESPTAQTNDDPTATTPQQLKEEPTEMSDAVMLPKEEPMEANAVMLSKEEPMEANAVMLPKEEPIVTAYAATQPKEEPMEDDAVMLSEEEPMNTATQSQEQPIVTVDAATQAKEEPTVTVDAATQSKEEPINAATQYNGVPGRPNNNSAQGIPDFPAAGVPLGTTPNNIGQSKQGVSEPNTNLLSLLFPKA